MAIWLFDGLSSSGQGLPGCSDAWENVSDELVVPALTVQTEGLPSSICEGTVQGSPSLSTHCEQLTLMEAAHLTSPRSFSKMGVLSRLVIWMSLGPWDLNK